jgi:hypothetical protein
MTSIGAVLRNGRSNAVKIAPSIMAEPPVLRSNAYSEKGSSRISTSPIPHGGRKPGQPNLMSKDIKTLLREAAEEVGFVQRVPVLDAAGEPTGQTE